MDMALSGVTPGVAKKEVGASCQTEQVGLATELPDVCALQLVELLDSSGDAMAVLNPQLDSIRWSSASWSRAFPTLSAGAIWSSELAASSELDSIYRTFTGQHATAGVKPGGQLSTMRCQATGQALTISLFTLSNGDIGLTAKRASHALGDMHLYMQNREHMFTTSRTISVSEMATTLAHEIKQPVATISNILKGIRLRLKREDLSAQQLDDSLASALVQTQFTNSVINRIRDFTQARRPQQQLLDLAVVTQEVLSLMDWLLSANQCRTELVITDEPLPCAGDPTMLQQVLVNLLRNGVEAMAENAIQDRLLVISCQRREARVRIDIRDSGQGLEGNEQSLFVPFSTSKANGMGVGLNICRSFVELHQGKLWLSQNEDGGCTSHIELPLAADSSDQSAYQSREAL